MPDRDRNPLRATELRGLFDYRYRAERSLRPPWRETECGSCSLVRCPTRVGCSAVPACHVRAATEGMLWGRDTRPLHLGEGRGDGGKAGSGAGALALTLAKREWGGREAV
ncbi:MAG: hypothetical protein ACM3US_02265 [Sphingomonadaceae bacterium]